MISTDTVHEHKRPMTHQVAIINIIKRVFKVQSDGKASVFIDISGHVQSLQVRVYYPQWVSDMEPSFDERVYLDGEQGSAVAMAKFQKKLFKYLETL